jgi:uncharacterized protein YqhQ
VKKKTEQHYYGGMAVIEGVMMRGKKVMATAVRRPSGEISVRTETVKDWRKGIWRWPFFRGSVALVDSLMTGLKALTWSATESAGEDEEPLGKGAMIFSVVVAILLAVLLFMVLPTVAAHWLKAVMPQPFLLNLAEGFLRVGIFILYVVSISLMADIRRVYSYHGAEHKTLNAFEQGGVYSQDASRDLSCMNPRCGTTFLFLVMMVSVFVFAFLGWPTFFWRIASRILLLPVIAGVSFELLRLSARTVDRPWGKIVWLPGMLLQKLTTREPDDAQLEVAEAALAAVFAAEKEESDNGSAA